MTSGLTDGIRVIRVRRWLTVSLLIVASAAMALSIDLLSGHAYQREPSFAEILTMVRRHEGSSPGSAVLAALTPAVAGVLFFVPWGALAFLTFDREGRSRAAVYGISIAAGVGFATGLILWQGMLATRVIGWQDLVWNAAGCAGGAAIGHARKRFRIRFQ
jgi:hypothetical protein